MKNILLLVFSLCFIGVSAQINQYDLFTDKTQTDPMISPKAQFKPIFKNVPVLEEDFESGIPGLPADWATNDVEQLDDDGNPLGTFVPGFVTGDADAANNGGFFPVPNIAGNNFAYANDDGPPCNCEMSDVWIQTPMMDFTSVVNAAVTFNAYQDGNFGSGDWTVQASTDGSSWVTEYTSYAEPDSGDASMNWQEIVVTLFDYDGESQVWLRFQWSDASSWASGFAIDNVVVDQLLDNNISLQEVFTADPNNPDLENVIVEYTQVPIEQTVPMWIGAAVSNIGLVSQDNIVVQAEIFMNGSSQGTFSSDPINGLAFSELDSVFIETGYIPSELGEVEVVMSVNSDQTDQDESNNSGSESFMVTTDTYARDMGVVTLFQSNTNNEFRSANIFEMPNNGTTVYGVAVAFGAGLTDPTQPGTICEVELLNADFEYLVGAEHEILASEISEAGESNFGIIAFEDFYEIQDAGEVVVGSVHHFGGNAAENVRVGLSGFSIDQTSFFQDETGTWFFTNSTPMIRLITQEITSLEDIDFESGIKLLQNYPNPFNDNTVIEFEIQNAQVVTIEVRDIEGKIVLSKNFGQLSAGPHRWTFNPENMGAGFYTYTLLTDNASISKKLIVE